MRLIDADALLERINFESNTNLKDEYFRRSDILTIITNAPTVQREGWVSVPIEPDKARFIGEFSIDITHHCSACNFHGAQDDCEVCNGKIEYVQKHTIPWTTFKKIYAEIVAAPTDTE